VGNVFISSVKMAGSVAVPGEDGFVDVAYPSDTNIGVLNMVCGQNNAGKSHFLFRMHDLVKSLPAKNTDNGIYAREGFQVRYIGDTPSKSLLLIDIPQYKEMIGVFNPNWLPGRNKGRADYQATAIEFLRRQVEYNVPEGTHIDAVQWRTDVNYRYIVLETFSADKETQYPCDPTDPLVIEAQRLLKGKLRFRRNTNNIELVLHHASGLETTYPRWSEGQQVLFFLLLCLDYERPDVLFVDELENHLHPAYMTFALEIIKTRARQAFVTSHHPHLIFSELADRVLFIEGGEEVGEREAFGPYRSVEKQSHPKRRVYALEDAFSKVTASYSLFDIRDSQLLMQANRIQKATDIMLISALQSVFAETPVQASVHLIPDRQTSSIREALAKWKQQRPKGDGGTVRILDFGAGYGRVAKEMAKFTRWQLGHSYEWICWEPNQTYRQRLREASVLPEYVTVPDTLKELEDSSCDLAVLANVLHEITPQAFAHAIVDIIGKLREDGITIILELSPILSPEKYAVPYAAAHLKQILHSCGFDCQERSFPVKDVTGYVLFCRLSRHHLFTEDGLLQAIEQTWATIERESLSEYHGTMGVRDFDNYNRMMVSLTAIASINAWRHGIWQ
jgi:SAM-dependent methyltransferase